MCGTPCGEEKGIDPPDRLLRRRASVLAERNDSAITFFDWSPMVHVEVMPHFSSVILEPSGGWRVCPCSFRLFPEVVTEGDTEEEALLNAQEAIDRPF